MKRVELAWLKVERSDGRSFSASPTLTSPWAVRSSALTEVMGTLDSRLGRRMREPVTTMFGLAGCWVAAGWSVQVPGVALRLRARRAVGILGEGGGGKPKRRERGDRRGGENPGVQTTHCKNPLVLTSSGRSIFSFKTSEIWRSSTPARTLVLVVRLDCYSRATTEK